MSPQKRHFAELIVRGVAPAAAGAYIGLDSHESIEMYKDKEVEEYITKQKTMMEIGQYKAPRSIKFTKDDATMLYLEAHRKAANSMEEVRAIDSLVKLHGLAEPEKHHLRIDKGAMREASEQELLEISGMGPIDLSPNTDGVYE